MVDSIDNLERLLMALRDLKKSDLDDILQLLWTLSHERNQRVHNIDVSNSTRAKGRTTTFGNYLNVEDREKIDIIGALPFFLLSKDYFKRQMDLVDFAVNQLGMSKRSFIKNRSVKEYIGVIVTFIAETTDTKKLSELRKTFSVILDKKERGEVKDFFTEWDNAIKILRGN